MLEDDGDSFKNEGPRFSNDESRYELPGALKYVAMSVDDRTMGGIGARLIRAHTLSSI